MQKLMPERIARTGEAPLSTDDLRLLKDKRNKQLLFILPPYIALLGIGLFKLISGVGGLPHGRVTNPVEYDDDDTQRFWTVAPYVFGFFFLMATIYFAKLFVQSIYPLMKDIKNKKKSLIFYVPAKNAMPFFNKYYLSTPLYKKQQVEISREDFESIQDNQEICLETGPQSVFILRLKNGAKEIKYY